MVSLLAWTGLSGCLIDTRYSKLPFGEPKELDRAYQHVVDLLDHAFDHCPKSGDEDLPLDEAALQAACIFDYLNRAVDDKGQKMPRNLIAPNMLPGDITLFLISIYSAVAS